MRPSSRSTAALLVTVVLATPRCGELIGAGDYASSPGSSMGPSGDASTDAEQSDACGGFARRFDDGDVCLQCSEHECCAEGVACRALPACAEPIDCRAGCVGDEVCAAGCGEADAGPESLAFTRCLRDRCLSACFPPGVVLPRGAGPDEPRACFDCVAKSCVDAHAACLDDAECADGLALGVSVSGEAWSLLSEVQLCGTVHCQTVCGLGGDWSCLNGSATLRGEEPEVEITFAITDFASGAALAGLTVRACNLPDPECANPVYETTSGADGEAVTVVPNGFDGVWEFTGNGVTPTLFGHVDPATAAVTRGVQIIDPQTLTGLAVALNVSIDESRGLLSVAVEDCSNAPAPGVAFTASPTLGASQFYFVDGAPSLGGTRTDQSGIGGYVNVAPTVVAVSATIAETGEEIAATRMLVRKGAMSILGVQPSN